MIPVLVLFGILAAMAVRTVSSLPIDRRDFTTFDLSRRSDALICDSSCVGSIFLTTGYASASAGLSLAMDFYNASGCGLDDSSACPDTIDAILMSIAANVTDNVPHPQRKKDHCDTECIVNGMELVGRRSAALALMYSKKQFAGVSFKLDESGNLDMVDRLIWTLAGNQTIALEQSAEAFMTHGKKQYKKPSSKSSTKHGSKKPKKGKETHHETRGLVLRDASSSTWATRPFEWFRKLFGPKKAPSGPIRDLQDAIGPEDSLPEDGFLRYLKNTWLRKPVEDIKQAWSRTSKWMDRAGEMRSEMAENIEDALDSMSNSIRPTMQGTAGIYRILRAHLREFWDTAIEKIQETFDLDLGIVPAEDRYWLSRDYGFDFDEPSVDEASIDSSEFSSDDDYDSFFDRIRPPRYWDVNGNRVVDDDDISTLDLNDPGEEPTLDPNEAGETSEPYVDNNSDVSTLDLNDADPSEPPPDNEPKAMRPDRPRTPTSELYEDDGWPPGGRKPEPPNEDDGLPEEDESPDVDQQEDESTNAEKQENDSTNAEEQEDDTVNAEEQEDDSVNAEEQENESTNTDEPQNEPTNGDGADDESTNVDETDGGSVDEVGQDGEPVDETEGESIEEVGPDGEPVVPNGAVSTEDPLDMIAEVHGSYDPSTGEYTQPKLQTAESTDATPEEFDAAMDADDPIAEAQLPSSGNLEYFDPAMMDLEAPAEAVEEVLGESEVAPFLGIEGMDEVIEGLETFFPLLGVGE